MNITKLEQGSDKPKLTLTIETLERLIKELESGSMEALEVEYPHAPILRIIK